MIHNNKIRNNLFFSEYPQEKYNNRNGKVIIKYF